MESVLSNQQTGLARVSMMGDVYATGQIVEQPNSSGEVARGGPVLQLGVNRTIAAFGQTAIVAAASKTNGV
jgi:hypothetical protein